MLNKGLLITLLVVVWLMAVLLVLLLTIPCPYRLGDCVRQNIKSLEFMTKIRYPNSIASTYLKENKDTKNIDIDLLLSLTSKRACSKRAYPVVIHLRIGDVIDNHPRSVSDFWEGNYGVVHDNDGFVVENMQMKWKGGANGCTCEGYVKSKKYYQNIIDKFPENVPRKGILVAGTHKPTNMTKSLVYIALVKKFFCDSGFSMDMSISDKPDAERADRDFVVMCNAKVYVPAGDGFSALAASLVSRRKNMVLTWD